VPIALLFCAPALTQTGDEEHLLGIASDAHRASRDSIRTLSCHVEFQLASYPASTAPVQTSSADFWFSSAATRLKAVDERGAKLDYLWKDKIRKSVAYPPGKDQGMVSVMRNSFSDRFVHRADAFACGMLALNVPGTVRDVLFEKLVHEASKIGPVQKQTSDGRSMVVVKLYFDKSDNRKDRWTVELHFDPAVNYLIRKQVYVCATAKGNFYREREVVQFQECKPGLFFPQKIVGRSDSDGKPFSKTSIEISAIRVNEPLPEGIFDFRYPQGAMLFDDIEGVRYQVDSFGNRISESVPITRQPPPPTASKSEKGMQTLDEPSHLSQWILPSSVAILTVAVAIALLRWYRRRKARAT
jgi:hypothetical protein